MNVFVKIYNELYKLYGPQGWWPVIIKNSLKTGSIACYHPGDYSFPKNKKQRFEICAGAILTQNTSWLNVVKALFCMKVRGLLSARAVRQTALEELKDAIHPAGYYNQKAVYLKEFADFYLSSNEIPTRKDILNIKGVGPETADSILLYAYQKAEFVVDAYTKRFFSKLGFFDEKASYNEIKEIFHRNLPESVVVFQEYHALIVEHAKRYYSKKTEYGSCPIFTRFSRSGINRSRF